MCGIIGISRKEKNAIGDIYDGLLMLQHRGQDSSGIVTFNGKKFYSRRGFGLVRDAFSQENIRQLVGNMGIGHCRYTTTGSFDQLDEAQPFFVNSPFGIYLIHNGNLTNTEELSKQIKNSYFRHLQTSSDTEVLLNIFADNIHSIMKQSLKSRNSKEIIFEAVSKLMKTITGAYSTISLIDQVGLLAFRDPYGIRPLLLGKKETTKGDEWIFASEDVAIKTLGYKVVRDVEPGEAILITLQGELISQKCAEGKLYPCIFEYVYLARPDSMMNKISVYKTRLRMGSYLAKQILAKNLDIDTVIPVPDSGRPLAIKIAKDIGVKYREGLVKNRYIGRTFIMPGQEMRKKSIKQKLNTIELEFRNRNVLLVDDSIVRGNTIKKIIDMCRKAGAKNIYVASGAPAVRHPDVYGVDIPTRSELIAHNLSKEEVCKAIGADELFYQNVDDLIAAAKEGNPEVDGFHTGVFDANYPTPEVTKDFLEKWEFEGRGKSSCIQDKITLPKI